jgi:epoxyqueuosine reductase
VRFVRNVLIAIGNSNDPALVERAVDLLADASPLVRGAAVWALGRLDPARLSAESARAAAEQDGSVLEEWRSLGVVS